MPTVSTRVEEVIVYTDRAMITRRGTAELSAGAHELLISDVPASLVAESVRAGGRGGVAVRITGVEVRTAYHSEAVQGDRRAKEAELQRLQDGDARLAEQATVIDAGLRFVRDLQQAAAPDMARGLARKRLEVSDCQSLLDFTRVRTQDALAALAEVAAERRAMADRIAALQQEIRDLGGGATRRAHDLVVGVEAAEAGDWELEVSYVAADARWTPIYDLYVRRTEEGPRVQIGYHALVRQQTGEDWPDTALALSTARPSLGTLPPKLAPWYIDILDQSRPVPAMARTRALSTPAAPVPMAASPAPPGAAVPAQAAPIYEATVEGAGIEQAGASVTYRLPGRAGIPADGAPHKVTVAEAEFPGQFAYECLPRQIPHAFARATVRNTGPLLFLPGKASIFQDGQFVGAITLHEPVAPQQEFTLYLGVDEGIHVEHQLTRRAVDKTLIGGSRRTASSYRITLRNNRSQAAQITVRDQIPVSRHEQLKVRSSRIEPQPAEQTDLGELRWELTLPPGGGQEISYDLTIEHPAGLTVIGL